MTCSLSSLRAKGDVEIHKYNYKEYLGGCDIDFPAIISKMTKYNGKFYQKTSVELGLNNGYVVLNVFQKKELLSVCRKVIKSLKSVNNGKLYSGRWQSLLAFLEKDIGDEVENEPEEVAPHSQRKVLPENFSRLYGSTKSDHATLTRLNVDVMFMLCKLRYISEADLEEFNGDIYVTLFVKDYVPFLLISYESICFDVLLEDVQMPHNLSVCITSDQSEEIASLRSIEIPEELLKRARNILKNSPFGDVEKLRLAAENIRGLVPRYDMIGLGATELACRYIV